VQTPETCRAPAPRVLWLHAAAMTLAEARTSIERTHQIRGSSSSSSSSRIQHDIASGVPCERLQTLAAVSFVHFWRSCSL